MLLDKGAKIDAWTKDGMASLHIAALLQQAEDGASATGP